MEIILTLSVQGVEYKFVNPSFLFDRRSGELYINESVDGKVVRKHKFKFLDEKELNLCSLKSMGLESV